MIKSTVSTFIILAASAGAALAHQGDHALSVANSIAHLLTEPDHLAMMAVASAAAFGVWRWRKAKV